MGNPSYLKFIHIVLTVFFKMPGLDLSAKYLHFNIFYIVFPTQYKTPS